LVVGGRTCPAKIQGVTKRELRSAEKEKMGGVELRNENWELRISPLLQRHGQPQFTIPISQLSMPFLPGENK
jgi:hypothetical protein